MASSSSSSNANANNEEAHLLSTLGSTSASASTYESSVLRRARLSAAPSIALPRCLLHESSSSSSSTLIPCPTNAIALPELHALAPSTERRVNYTSNSNVGVSVAAAAADVPHIINVLTKTQHALSDARSKPLACYNSTSSNNTNNDTDDDDCRRNEKQREIDTLSIKISILKCYLKEIAKLDNDLIPSCIRKKRLLRNGGEDGNDYYGTMYDEASINAMDVAAATGGGDSNNYESLKKKRKGSKSNNNNESDNGKKLSSTSSNDGLTVEPSTNRLDRIKNGQFVDNNNNYYNNNTNNNTNNNSNNNSKLRRRTMMQMKSDMRIQSGLTPLKSVQEEKLFDKERSKKRREERRKRRLARQRRALGFNDDDEGEDNVNVEDGGLKKEEEQTMNHNVSSTNNAKEVVSILKRRGGGTGDDSLTRSDNIDTQKPNESDTADPKQNGVYSEASVKPSNCTDNNSNLKQNGVCWDASVKIMQDDTDKKSNISPSLNNSNKNNDNNTTTSPKKRTYTKVMCPICQIILTCDDEDNIKPDEFLSKHIEQCQQNKASSTGRSLRKRTKPTIVDIDDDDDDLDYDEEASSSKPKGAVRVGEVDETMFDNDASSDNDNDTSIPKQNPEHYYNRETKIDDMDEFDYEDRVDDWIERGIDRMNVMSERDSNEAPPGAVVYEGGLEIPAWINNRLFPYQRTGVRWLWELHCQGAGGVVGDEMGLGKTVQVSAFVGAMAANRYLDSVL
eukprot:scaffold13251_cov78-Cyclotella_meneghiniana.AAC.1